MQEHSKVPDFWLARPVNAHMYPKGLVQSLGPTYTPDLAIFIVIGALYAIITESYEAPGLTSEAPPN